MSKASAGLERTFIILKPDCLTRGLSGKVISRFEERGMKIIGAKLYRFTDKMCQEHYAHLKDKPFFPRLAKFMQSTPVLLMVLEGKEAVRIAREMCGPTNARNAAPGTIRGDFALSTQSNIIHASDSLETAGKEIGRFFKDEELYAWEPVTASLLLAEDERQ